MEPTSYAQGISIHVNSIHNPMKPCIILCAQRISYKGARPCRSVCRSSMLKALSTTGPFLTDTELLNKIIAFYCCEEESYLSQHPAKSNGVFGVRG